MPGQQETLSGVSVLYTQVIGIGVRYAHSSFAAGEQEWPGNIARWSRGLGGMKERVRGPTSTWDANTLQGLLLPWGPAKTRRGFRL